MSTLHSAGVINGLAGQTVGISTPHFLYLNEATHELLRPKAAKRATKALKAIGVNSRAIESCSLPPCKNPRELLLHLSQSNAYHRQLADDVGLATEVFGVYHRLSGVPYHERLAEDPRPLVQSLLYDPAEHDPFRGISAMWKTVECRDSWARIPATENAFEDFIDLFQPPLHLLIGGFMTYFAMMEQIDKGHMHLGVALDWFQLMGKNVFFMILRGTEFVAPMIHDLQTGAILAAISSKAESQSAPDTPQNELDTVQSMLDPSQIEQLVTVLLGIDSGLKILSRELLIRDGKMAIQLGQQAHELRVQNTTPLIERLIAASTPNDEIAEG